MADQNTQIVAPSVNVGAQPDFSKLTDDQLEIAERIISRAEAEGKDPEEVYSAFKGYLDIYKDPNAAAIAQHAGKDVADQYMKSKDLSVLPDETLDFLDTIHGDQEVMPVVQDIEVETLPGEYSVDPLAQRIGEIGGAATGYAAGQYSDKAIEKAEKAEALTRRPAEAAAKKVARAEERIGAKGTEQTSRVTIQTTMAEDAAKEAARLRADALAAEERLAKATDNARRFGVIEETVKTTPGGVTQEGGLGSGAMRHSNVMGEIHEANVVRKGTEAAGPGYSQKSRLIVPDKYASAELYNPEQKAAQAEYAAAQKEHDRLMKAADKAEGAAQKQAERLRNLTVRGPTGLTAAEAQLEAAKQAYSEASKNVKQPSRFVEGVRKVSKIPGTYVLPGVAGGFDLAEAVERYKQGDIPGAVISGIGAAGGALSMVPPVGPIGAGARVLGTGMSLAAPAAQYFRDKGNKAPADLKFAGGGLVQLLMKQGAKKEAIKASEALGAHEGKTLMTTQADRTKVGEGYLGGPGFSGIQLYDPAYADVGATWAVGNAPTASTIINANSRVPLNQAIWIPMIGSPTQHKSNSMVFDQIMKDFKFAAKKGKLDPELREAINLRIANTVDPKTGEPVFDLSKPIDILSPKFQKQLNTFDKRAAVADILGGKGVGGKKGSIIDYENIIRETTDPDLLDAPTGSLGSRLFTLSGEKLERPDLHPAFPHVLTGEDLGVHFKAAPREILLGDYLKTFREAKGREPGYMDLTRGLAPSNVITEEMLTNLQKAGFKRGGLAQACSCMHEK
jgi:hypothetical protein